MCRLASKHIGQVVTQKTFKELNDVAAFDGIWACAALLHETRGSIDAVLDKLCRALKPGGVLFMSFKLRDGGWTQGDRSFNGYCENSLRELLAKHHDVSICSIWASDDVRPGRQNERWLNSLVQRILDASRPLHDH